MSQNDWVFYGAGFFAAVTAGWFFGGLLLDFKGWLKARARFIRGGGSET
jgi:hypothetical protein